MKIGDSAIQLYSQHTSLYKNELIESLLVWKGGQDRQMVADTDGKGRKLELLKIIAMDSSVQVSLSDEVKNRMSVQQKTDSLFVKDDKMVDLKLLILQDMIERLTGRKIQTTHIGDVVRAENAPVAQAPAANGQNVSVPQGDTTAQNVGFGAVYEYHASHFEYESTSLQPREKFLPQTAK